MSDPLLDLSLNQTFRWWQKTGESDTGRPQFAAPVEIRGRCSYKLRQLISAAETTVTSQAQVTTLAQVSIDDKLEVDGRAWPVLAVSKPVTLAGTVHRRKAWI